MVFCLTGFDSVVTQHKYCSAVFNSAKLETRVTAIYSLVKYLRECSLNELKLRYSTFYTQLMATFLLQCRPGSIFFILPFLSSLPPRMEQMMHAFSSALKRVRLAGESPGQVV